MNAIEKLNELEKKLISLKERYRSESVYSDSKHTELQERAKREYRPFTKFEGHYTGAWGLCLLVQEKVAQGYTCRTDDHQTASVFGAGSFWIYMLKPDDLVSSELIELEQQVKADYLSNIEKTKARLVSEIASTQLEIKKLSEQIKAEAKHDSEYRKMLASVQAELSQSVDTQEKPTNINPAFHTELDGSADTNTEAEQ